LQGSGVIAAETRVSRECEFRALYEEHARAVRAYLARRVEPDNVDDLAANTFMIAWRRLPGEIEDPLPWLYGVARNQVRAHRRRVAMRHRLTEKLMAFTPRDARVEPPREPPVFGSAFARLTDEEREAILLVAFEDLDHREAGRLAGCTPETFTVRVSRARKKLGIAAAGALVPLLALAAIALSPARHDTLLERAFGDEGSEILYWRIRTLHGIAYDDNDISVIVATLEKAAHGHLDLPVGADGSVRVRRQTATNPNPSQVAVTIWLNPKTAKPTRIQWGDAKNIWSQNAQVERFESLPDDAENRALLKLGG
jgi:RNA polymerase sigma factor (sigma-70 family)